jgi:hypothetical protein
VRYINLKYKRKGHLFADRFNSKLIKNQEQNLTVSAYIHNNPKDMPGYCGKEYEYKYSSLGIYLGLRKDTRKIIDMDYVLGTIDSNNREMALKAYIEFVIENRDMGTKIKLIKYAQDFEKEQYSYSPFREVLLRNKKPEEVIKFLADKLGVNDIAVLMRRWYREGIIFRSIVAYALTTLCGLNYKQAAKFMYNITSSCCSRLSNNGYKAMTENSAIKDAVIALMAA